MWAFLLSPRGLEEPYKHRSYYYSTRFLPPLIGIVTVALLLPYLGSTALTNPKLQTNLALPQITTEGLTGKLYSVSDFKGKPVLLDFMAAKCPHCQQMAPVIKALYQEYGDKVTFISVAGTFLGDDERSTAAFINKYGQSWLHLFDREQQYFERYSVTGTPTYLLLDEELKEAERITGEVSSFQLAQALRGLLS